MLVFWFDCDGDPNALKTLAKGSVIPGTRRVIPGDRNGGWRMGGSEKKGGVTTLNGEVRTQVGKRVHFEWETTNGRPGKARIDDQEFDVDDGDLFLVTTRNEPPQIQQLRRDFRSVRLSDTNFLSSLAQKDSDVAKFIAQATPSAQIRHFSYKHNYCQFLGSKNPRL